MQKEYALRQKQSELARRLLDRYGAVAHGKVQIAISKLHPKRLAMEPLDALEREIERDLGHWSHHIGYDDNSLAPAAGGSRLGLQQNPPPPLFDNTTIDPSLLVHH